mgnify:CR=1 FL=1
MKNEIRHDEYIYYEFEDIETNETVLCKIPIYIYTNAKNTFTSSDNQKSD